MTDAQLKLLDLQESDPPVKSKTWQQSFAGIFWFKFKEATGEECKIKFGGLKKMLTAHGIKHWVDDETGAPELPSVGEWTDEVNAFFQDKFAGEERGFHFGYLLKQYGSFKKHKAQKRVAESDVILTHTCANHDCKHVMEYPRSFWLRSKNKVGRCSKCNTTFNVNDILNRIPTIKNYLPGGSNDNGTHQ